MKNTMSEHTASGILFIRGYEATECGDSIRSMY